jgi:tetratricopeptide (TPR) repeat protein
VLVGAGIYEARQASQLREQNQTLQQQQAPLAEQVRQLQSSLSDATNQLAGLLAENLRLKSNPERNELLKLRGEVGVLRSQLADVTNKQKQAEQPPLATAREYLQRADRHGSNREYEAQLEDLNKAIELDPNMAEAYLERGNLYSMNLPKERGCDKKAVADYTSCLEIKPDDLWARWNRATHYRSLGKADEAIADWTVIIQGNVDFSKQMEGKTKTIARALLWRGVIYQQNKKDYSKAIADYNASLQFNPNGEDVHRLRGECYELLGETEKAQADFAIEPKR